MSTGARTADVVIIGAGIIGAASAYELAARGVDVLLLDRDGTARHQSGRNWGFVRQQGRSPYELPLMRLANQRWQVLEDELAADIGWVQGGNLAIYDDVDAAGRYANWAHMARGHGVTSQPMDLQELRTVLPHWRRPSSGALFAADDGHADPTRSVHAYVGAATRRGARASLDEAVLKVDVAHGKVTGVTTTAGRISAAHVVCAAGAWSRSLLAAVGVNLPQSYVHGTVSLTNPQPPLTRATVWAPGLAFRQRPDGRLVVTTGGGGVVDVGLDSLAQASLFLPALRNNRARFQLRPGRRLSRELAALCARAPLGTVGPPEARVNARQARQALVNFASSVAGLPEVRLERCWAGVIDSTPDGLPVLDSGGVVEGLVVAAGFSGHGFGLGPAAGAAVADLTYGTAPLVDLSPMCLARFGEGRFSAPSAIL